MRVLGIVTQLIIFLFVLVDESHYDLLNGVNVVIILFNVWLILQLLIS